MFLAWDFVSSSVPSSCNSVYVSRLGFLRQTFSGVFAILGIKNGKMGQAIVFGPPFLLPMPTQTKKNGPRSQVSWALPAQQRAEAPSIFYSEHTSKRAALTSPAAAYTRSQIWARHGFHIVPGHYSLAWPCLVPKKFAKFFRFPITSNL